MNKAFEKILERLDEMIHPKQLYFCKYAKGECKHLDNDDKNCAECTVELAKQIVQEVAEEYTSTEHINCSTNTSTNGWIPIKTRPMTEEEKEYYSEYLFEGNGFIYECPLPNDGQEVLITSNYGSVDKTTFYTDCGNYFENYEDYDEVIAWQPLPQPYKESE